MTAKIFQFDGDTRLPIDPDKVLTSCVGELDEVLVIGKDKDGFLYVAASHSEVGTMLLYMERAKIFLMRALEDQGEY